MERELAKEKEDQWDWWLYRAYNELHVLTL